MAADRFWSSLLASLALHALAVGLARPPATPPSAASPQPISLAINLIAPTPPIGQSEARLETRGPVSPAGQTPKSPAQDTSARRSERITEAEAPRHRATAREPAASHQTPQTSERLAAQRTPVEVPLAAAIIRHDERHGLETAEHESVRSELSRLLHLAIAARQHYPLSARRMRREGTARVGFRLRPDGRVGAVELTQSTGYEALDRAALSAVEAIQPFAPAAKFLASAEEFQVDIIFRLGN